MRCACALQYLVHDTCTILNKETLNNSAFLYEGICAEAPLGSAVLKLVWNAHMNLNPLISIIHSTRNYKKLSLSQQIVDYPVGST